MAGRNPYVVTKALNSYLKGSVIIAISGHLVTTTDALIVSWLIGSKAFTAINIVIPVLTLFSSIMILLGTGASISISKSLGRRDKERVNLSFSSSVLSSLIIGVVVAVLTYRFNDDIIRYLVHSDIRIEEYAVSYLKTFCYAVPFLIVSGVIGYMVRADGNSNLVSTAVWIGMISNVGLDILFIHYFSLGVAGAAWATAINYILKLCICLIHFGRTNNTISWSSRYRYYFKQFLENCRLGFSTSLNNTLLAVTLFVINSIMLKYHGAEGIYCWAVCYQIFLITQMILSGMDTGIFAVGGVLLGEDDVKGLDYLYRRCAIYLIITVLILSASIIIFPEFFGKIFGNHGDDRLDLLPSVLKIFSFFLLPYALIMQVRSIYTILERGGLSLFLCITPFALMIVFVFLASLYKLDYFWWGFPASSWLILFFLLIYTAIIHLKNKNLRMFSLIPKSVEDPSYYVTVPLNTDAVENSKSEISDFLKKQNIGEQKINYISLVTNHLMDDILVNLSQNKKNNKFFDINIRIKKGKIIVIIKDAGKRIDRERESEIIQELNQKPINQNVTNPDQTNMLLESTPDYSVSYFYMNEQNTFTLYFN